MVTIGMSVRLTAFSRKPKVCAFFHPMSPTQNACAYGYGLNDVTTR
jgi:hypothetical protein